MRTGWHLDTAFPRVETARHHPPTQPHSTVLPTQCCQCSHGMVLGSPPRLLLSRGTDCKREAFFIIIPLAAVLPARDVECVCRLRIRQHYHRFSKGQQWRPFIAVEPTSSKQGCRSLRHALPRTCRTLAPGQTHSPALHCVRHYVRQ